MLINANGFTRMNLYSILGKSLDIGVPYLLSYIWCFASVQEINPFFPH